MTNKLERAAMQQALEALERSHQYIDEYHPEWIQVRFENEGAITALREALAEQAEQEPVAWVAEDVCDGQFINGRKRRIWWECIEGAGTPLYAAPVRTKDLTDDEIYPLYPEGPMCDKDMIDFARAVISKFKEKNK